MSRKAAWMGETVGLVSKEYAQHNTVKLDLPPQGIARLRLLRVGFLRAVGREVVDLVSTGLILAKDMQFDLLTDTMQSFAGQSLQILG